MFHIPWKWQHFEIMSVSIMVWKVGRTHIELGLTEKCILTGWTSSWEHLLLSPPKWAGNLASCLLRVEAGPFSGMFLSLLTYSTEHSPSWEANWFAASQEIFSILWNLNVHYHSHKCPPPPVPILSQLDPVHTSTSHFLKIHLDIILPHVSNLLLFLMPEDAKSPGNK